MTLIRPGVLLLAALLAAPALWRAAVDGQLDLNSALIRFLIAVPVAIVMVSGLRLLTADYRRMAAPDLLPDQDQAFPSAAQGANHRSTELVEESPAAV